MAYERLLIEAANAGADALESRRASAPVGAKGPPAPYSEMSELDERNERIGQAYMERAEIVVNSKSGKKSDR